MAYCEISDVQNVLPDKSVIGTDVSEPGVNIATSDAEFWIEQAAQLIDEKLSTIYRVPLIPFKEPDFSQNPIIFEEKYPANIVMINAQLAASYLYDRVIMAQQEPGESAWGGNTRSLAMDSLQEIMSGVAILRGQVFTGFRFVRRNLYDEPRVSRPGEFPVNQRQSGK